MRGVFSVYLCASSAPRRFAFVFSFKAGEPAARMSDDATNASGPSPVPYLTAIVALGTLYATLYPVLAKGGSYAKSGDKGFHFSG
jgi:hypothetical protein